MKLKIERLGLEGDGVGRGPDGEAYVPFTLPGEIVSVEIVDGLMKIADILERSPHRINPVCRHFGSCGGCSLQHASDEFLATWKVETVIRALAAHGLGAKMRPIVVAPVSSRRRATFAGRRTKKTVQVGFHARLSNTVVPINECHVIEPQLLAAVPVLAGLTRIGATRSSPIRAAVTLTDAGLDVGITDAKEMSAEMRSDAIKLASDHDFARLTWNGEIVVAARPAAWRFGRAVVSLPPLAFGQATAAGETELVARVSQATDGAERIVDLFSGCGTFALPLAEKAEVHAVEMDSAMLTALDHGWRQASNLKRVSHEIRDLFSRPLLAKELDRFDAIVLDPPRAGASAQCHQIAESKVNLVAYVSCNPVTFARDVKLLVGRGFEIDWIQVVDQFRWSGHVELVASLRRQPIRLS